MPNERPPEEELEKASVCIQLGRALVDLVKAIRLENGLYDSTEAHETYRRLRQEIMFAGAAQDADYQLSEVHMELGVSWPAALYHSRYDEDDVEMFERLWTEDTDEKTVWWEWTTQIQESVQALEVRISEAYERIGFVDVPLPEKYVELIRDSSELSRRLSSAKEDYLRALSGETASLISSFSVEAAEKDFDFEFVDAAAIREALEERLHHTYEAFRNRLYGLAAVAANSIVEALLIYGLKQRAADAAIEFTRRFPIPPNRRDYPNHVDRWNSHELRVVAQALGMDIDSEFFGLLKRASRAGNGIHLYKLVNDSMALDYAEATLILSVAHTTTRIVRDWVATLGHEP